MVTNEQNVITTMKQMERIMNASMSRIANEITRLQAKRKLTPAKYGNAIKANKELLASIKKEYESLSIELTDYSDGRMTKAWSIANAEKDALVTATLTGKIATKYLQSNPEQLAQFLKSSPMRTKIYELTADSEQLVKDYLVTGITQGRGANAIARDLNRINSNPYDVPVFDKLGNPTKLKKMSPFLREYKAQPGQYKKPLANLKRLARTETNKAYHNAENERIAQIDFIVGYEVHLSDSHATKMPKGDMCDSLKGKYPKTFKFDSWHPACNCYTTTILKTNKEIREESETSVNTIKEIPKSATNYIKNATDSQKNYDWYKENVKK